MSADDEFHPAEMKPAMAALHETLETAAEEMGGDWKAVYDDWCELWARPHDYARGALSGGLDPNALVFFHLGVAFGIDYEQAYPEGREDEWPVPVEDRPRMEADHE